jgi:hypothetical protein
MHRMKRASGADGSWANGSVVPQWFFWFVLVAIALGCGLAIGYLGSPASSNATSIKGASDGGDSEEASRGEQTTSRDGAGGGSGLITKGVTVQVLNASGRGKTDNPVIDDLRELGYQIVAVNPAAKIYDKTTVFWSERSGKEASQALADHFDWKSGPSPNTLTSSVVTHIVVGRDEI